MEFAALIQSLTYELLRSSPPRPSARVGRGSAPLRALPNGTAAALRGGCAANPTGALLDVWRLQTCPVLDNRPRFGIISPLSRAKGLLCFLAMMEHPAGAPYILRTSPTGCSVHGNCPIRGKYGRFRLWGPGAPPQPHLFRHFCQKWMFGRFLRKVRHER